MSEQDNPLAKINLRDLRARLLSANLKLRNVKRENSYLQDLIFSYKKVIGFYQDMITGESADPQHKKTTAVKSTGELALAVEVSPDLELIITVEGDAIVKKLYLRGEFVGTSIDYLEEIVELLLPNDIERS